MQFLHNKPNLLLDWNKFPFYYSLSRYVTIITAIIKEHVMGDTTKQDLYNARVKRFHDAIALKEPDRVPIIEPGTNTFAYYDAGYTMAEILYDLKKTEDAIRKYLTRYEIDAGHTFGSVLEGQGPILEKSKVKNFKWAGMPNGAIPPDSIHQFIEYPLVEDDELKELVTNRGAFCLSKILPRSFGLLEPLKHLNLDALFATMFSYRSLGPVFARQDVREMISELVELDGMWAAYGQEAQSFAQEVEEMGFPLMTAAPLIFPFDCFSDFLRGTIGASIDVYDHPEELFAFLEVQLEIQKAALKASPSMPGRIQFIPMHKGMDGFLSDEHYEKYYWRFARELIDLILERGMIPYIYTEGKYTTRLKYLKTLPKGKTIVHFEEVDMALAKKELGDIACLAGNFPAYTLTHATKQQVIDETKKLLDICAPGGGYIFDFDGGLYSGSKRENVEALFETVKTYGKY
jgi:hypothetical protein